MEKGKKGRRPFPPYDRISTTHGTIAARAVSFYGQLLSSVTPLQLAQNGLYYKLLGLNNQAACYFACRTTTPLTIFLRAPIKETLRLHTENYIWQIIYYDLKSYFENPNPVFQSTNTSIKSTPIYHHFPSNRLPSKTTTSNLTISLAQPTYKPYQPVAPLKFTLTIEDLHCCFHNKPPPFKDDKKTRNHLANRACNKRASAIHSLVRFLHSALPAFSRFLSEMQPNLDSRCPSHLKVHNSRAIRAA
ncbi:unnamed protein product [Penicillium salamii]|nr:unnamed protein product [Penicillium salamii]